jgi:formamidopyrimidine-DNA glycosylase
VPELPDVESYRRFFERHAEGRTVRRVIVPDPTIVRNADPEALDRALRGRRFEAPERIGKWLICWTDGPALLLHFGMTGFFAWSGDEPERHRHDRVILELEGGGELRYRNMRKLGGAWLAHDRDEASRILGPIGPDALAVSRRDFLDRLGRRRGGVKAALMDQHLVAGVGNIVADEVLWQARLHPRTRIESMDDEQRRSLFSTMHAVLKEAVERYDYIPRKRGWLSHVRGHRDAACPRCGTPLERITAAGRTTYFCPSCQPAPRDDATRTSRAARPSPPPSRSGSRGPAGAHRAR